VEIKKSAVADGSKINHLSYVGDATIGRDVNVGAGTITCNYDGVNKHRTTIEDGAFIGSDSALVAPVTIGRGAYVAAANRVQYALKTYPNAPANEEGLLILVQAYDKLGMTDLRNDAERVMKTNFPDSKYLSGKGVTKGTSWWQIWNVN